MNTQDIFTPSHFFDLENCQFQDIFHPQQPVWSALGKTIANYLKEHFDPATNDIKGEVHPSAILEGSGIIICEGAKVEATAFIRGPAFIGTGTEVRHGAYVRGNVIAGENCVIGHTTEMKNAILLNDAKAGHFAYVGDSILGNRVNLGAGTKLANLKVVKDAVSIRHEKEVISTGLRKFGAILGDDVEMGCNSVTNPGTILAKRSIVCPCVSVMGCHLKRVFLRK